MAGTVVRCDGTKRWQCSQYFNLPSNRVIELGTQVEI
jgi:K+ transporter